MAFVYLSWCGLLIQGSSMAAWYAGAVLGVLGFVGFILCIVGVCKGSGTTCGVLGILGFLAKVGLILLALKQRAW